MTERDERTYTDPELLRHLARAMEVAAHAYSRRAAGDDVWIWAKRATLTVGFVAVVGLWLSTYGGLFGLRPEPVARSVAVITVGGEIADGALASAAKIVPLIHDACEDDRIEGVVLKIASPGGSPSHAERIARALERCRSDGRSKRVTAVIDGLGASAAYLIAVHADVVIANRYALVGSLGAVTSRFELGGALEKLGIKEQTYASGVYKSMLSPWRPDTPEQAALARSIVDGIATLFRHTVEERRGDRLVEDPELWTGRVWIAADALKLGLIDGIDVLEPYLAREFPGCAVHYMQPKRTLSEQFGSEALFDLVAQRVLARLTSPEVR